MHDATPSQLRFPAIAGFTVSADFEGGALSSDFSPLLLRGIERQCGLIGGLAQAIHDRRHPSYIEHSLVDLLRQLIYQSACGYVDGYVDGNDANSLRRDPMFKLALGRAPLDETSALAFGADLLAPGEQPLPQGHLPVGQGLRRGVHRQLRAGTEHHRAGHGPLRRPHPRPAGVGLLQPSLPKPLLPDSAYALHCPEHLDRHAVHLSSV